MTTQTKLDRLKKIRNDDTISTEANTTIGTQKFNGLKQSIKKAIKYDIKIDHQEYDNDQKLEKESDSLVNSLPSTISSTDGSVTEPDIAKCKFFPKNATASMLCYLLTCVV